MKTTVNFHDFQDAFRRMDRAGQFSRPGLRALFDYLEELECETGDEHELDVVALCCDFAEYDTAEDAAEEYGWTPEDGDNPLEWLQEQTSVIEVHGHTQVIVQSF